MKLTLKFKRAFSLIWAQLESGQCPHDWCRYWGVNDDGEKRCALSACGLRCCRDPQSPAAPPNERPYDWFTAKWCDGARAKLPTPFIREFFFPTEWDRKAWRRKRYERRAKGRARALARR